MALDGLQMPRLVEVDKNSLTETYGKFTMQPLERGFGITLGHALRRVLVSSIQGAAIKSITLEGVQHEFSVVEGVQEDVPELVLNLKEVALRYHGEEERDALPSRELHRGRGVIDAILLLESDLAGVVRELARVGTYQGEQDDCGHHRVVLHRPAHRERCVR